MDWFSKLFSKTKEQEESIDGDGAVPIYILVLLVGVFAISSPEISFLQDHLPELLLNTTKDIGSTLIAAVVVIFTVERFTRKTHKKSADKLIRKINQNLYKAIYLRQIPEVLLREVEASVFQTKVYRSQYRVKYNLEIVPPEEDAKKDDEQHLSVETTSRYCLSNITDEQIDTDISAHYELPLDDKWKEYVSVTEVSIDGKELSSEDIGKHTTTDKKQLTFDYPITIPSNSKILVFLKGKLIKRTEDVEVFASFLPSEGLELTVYLPENFDVEATANHRCSLIEESDVATAKTWRLDNAILPFQSIVFWWKPSQK